ncbi:MBL fold metallo-hydrolase, partial [Synechococcus sp. R70.1]|uniref:MBL fold metallo-hydrolase n=1 Tax=Synechococcus sp. R70.1 TaxID=2964531 RepID=UPI0039C199FB
MLFRQLFDAETSTYTYLVADPNAREAALVDPVLEQVERDLKLIRELGLTLKYCLETHVHADHITGTGKLRELTGCQGVVPVQAKAQCADHFIGHGETLQVGSITIEAIATLGHTDSHMTYRVNGDRVLTGDSLLIRGCGRTDFQSGDPGLMYDHVT